MKEKERLNQLLQQKPKSPAVPLVIILPRGHLYQCLSVEEVNKCLELTELVDEGLISAVHLAQPFVGGGISESQKEWTEQVSCAEFFLPIHL